MEIESKQLKTIGFLILLLIIIYFLYRIIRYTILGGIFGAIA